MLDHPWGRRVECLNEVRPGKICGAHRLAEQPCCGVCGASAPVRPVIFDAGTADDCDDHSAPPEETINHGSHGLHRS